MRNLNGGEESSAPSLPSGARKNVYQEERGLSRSFNHICIWNGMVELASSRQTDRNSRLTEAGGSRNDINMNGCSSKNPIGLLRGASTNQAHVRKFVTDSIDEANRKRPVRARDGESIGDELAISQHR